MHHFKSIGEFKLELQSGNAKFMSKSVTCLSCVTFKFKWLTLENNRAPFLCCFKLCASLHSHQWILTGVTVRKRPVGSKSIFFVPCDLEIRQMTLENNRAPLVCYFELCAPFRSHQWIQTVTTVGKFPIWDSIDDFFSPVTLKFVTDDLQEQ